MELTFRQKAFLSKVVDLYYQSRQPLHYSAIAERLGLSNSTAYDMLRLLEQKGLVVSEYVLPKISSGPGRSNVTFLPSAKARELFSQLTGDNGEEKEWEEAKVRILVALGEGKVSEYRGLLYELLTRIPKTHSPLVCCAEVITALLLTLREVNYRFHQRSSLNVLLAAPASKSEVSLFAGLAWGLILGNRVSKRLIGNFAEHIKKYEASLRELTPKGLEILYKFTQDVVVALSTDTP